MIKMLTHDPLLYDQQSQQFVYFPGGKKGKGKGKGKYGAWTAGKGTPGKGTGGWGTPKGKGKGKGKGKSKSAYGSPGGGGTPKGKGKGKGKAFAGTQDLSQLTKKQILNLLQPWNQSFPSTPTAWSGSQGSQGSGAQNQKPKNWKTRLCKHVAAGNPHMCPKGGAECPYGHDLKKYDQQGYLLKARVSAHMPHAVESGWADAGDWGAAALEDALWGASPAFWQPPPGLNKVQLWPSNACFPHTATSPALA